MKHGALALLATALLGISCLNPLPVRDKAKPGGGSLNVTFTAAQGSRTIVPDPNSSLNAFTEFRVQLHSREGYPDLSQTDSLAPWSVSFPEVTEGNWDISVSLWRGPTQVGLGSLPGVAIYSGTSIDATVNVAFNPGNVHFLLRLPDTTTIDYVKGELDGQAAQTPSLVAVGGGLLQAQFDYASLIAGNYSMVLTFKRGNSAGTSAGIFREKVVVRDGFTSDAWVGPGGALVPERAFGVDEFLENQAELLGLSIPSLLPLQDFSSAQFEYPIVVPLAAEVTTFTAVGTVAGQALSYQWNNDPPLPPFVPIGSTQTSPPLVLQDYNTLLVRVTAPDQGGTHRDYTVTFRKGYRVSYSENGGGGLPPLDSGVYLSSQAVPVPDNPTGLSRPNFGFTGWSLYADGSGPVYDSMHPYTMGTSDAQLYARWIATYPLVVTFTIPNPSYGVISLIPPPPGSVHCGVGILFQADPPLPAATDWHWYVDGTEYAASPSFNWSPPSTPGQHIISVDAMYQGYPCTGSMRVTVEY